MKKGFTLIELLAVIMILVLLSLITTVLAINIIEKAKDKADLESVYGMMDSARLYYAESVIDNTKKYNIDNLNDIFSYVSVLNKPDNGNLYVNNNGLIALAIKIRNKCYKKLFGGVIKITEDSTCELKYVGTDITAPTVNFDVYEGTFNDNGWANHNFNVNITILDDESGPNSYLYCMDTKDCVPTVLVDNYIGYAQISTDSFNNKVCVIGIDNYGNESLVICSNEYKLDSFIPILTSKPGDILITENDNNLISNYFNNPIYGISGGSLSCNPINTNDLFLGFQTVSCTATSNSDLSTTATKSIMVYSKNVESGMKVVCNATTCERHAIKENGDIYAANTTLGPIPTTDINSQILWQQINALKNINNSSVGCNETICERYAIKEDGTVYSTTNLTSQLDYSNINDNSIWQPITSLNNIQTIIIGCNATTCERYAIKEDGSVYSATQIIEPTDVISNNLVWQQINDLNNVKSMSISCNKNVCERYAIKQNGTVYSTIEASSPEEAINMTWEKINNLSSVKSMSVGCNATVCERYVVEQNGLVYSTTEALSPVGADYINNMTWKKINNLSNIKSSTIGCNATNCERYMVKQDGSVYSTTEALSPVGADYINNMTWEPIPVLTNIK